MAVGETINFLKEITPRSFSSSCPQCGSLNNSKKLQKCYVSADISVDVSDVPSRSCIPLLFHLFRIFSSVQLALFVWRSVLLFPSSASFTVLNMVCAFC